MRSWEATRNVTMDSGKPVIGPYVGGIIQALSERLIPDGGELSVSVDETGSYEFLARYLRDMGGARTGMKVLFIVFDLLPFLFIGRFSRFTKLSPSEQELYLVDWAASRIYYRRIVVVLLKTLTGMGFYNDPKVLEAMRYKIPCPEEETT